MKNMIRGLFHFLKRKPIKIGFGLLLFLALAEAVAIVWLTPSQAFRIVFGTFFVIFLPGFILTYVFFPGSRSIMLFDKDDSPSIDWVERLVFAFILSLAVVPLVVYLANRMGMPITALTVAFLILGIIAAGLIVLIWRKKF